MRGNRRKSKGRGALAVLVAVLVVTFVLLASGTALGGPPWSDASNAWWVAGYGVTDTQAATVADGYPDGTFRPGLVVTRAQFAKMVVDGIGVPTAMPAVPSFSDVPRSNYFYPWIEGGAQAGIISGFGDGSFGPNNKIVRQQADNILGSYLAQKELNLRGHIAGHLANYPSLNTWYLAEGLSVLNPFADASRLATVHAPATAYLVLKGVVEGTTSAGWMYLGPDQDLTRAQATALILRVQAVTFSTAVPTVTSLNPSSGLAAGGNTVVITGTNFTGVTSVAFGLTNVAFTVNSVTQITVTAPPGTVGTTADITVTTAGGTSATGAASKYTYGVPTLTGLSPASGSAAGGNNVVITGTNLSGATAVKFGTKAATFTVNSNTQITATAPSGTAGTTVDVTVTAPGGTTVTSAASKYSYGGPTVTLLSPTSGPAAGGTTVIITGTGFTGVTSVYFGSKLANFTVNSSTQIMAIAPSGGAGSTVDVQVTTYAGTSATSSASKYSYGGPIVTLLSPNAGPAYGGNTVIISGTGFTGVTSVYFGNKPALAFTVNSVNQITAVAPSYPAGTTVDVTVTNASGTSGTSSATVYSYGLLNISSLSPNSGSTLGGTFVTITGSGFTYPATVTFGGAGYPATSVHVVDSTTITCISPAHGSGTVNVVVTTSAGSSSTSGTGNDFTYQVAASTPLAIVLDRGASNPVGSVVNVAIPAPGNTDYTGKVLGWVANTFCDIKFTVIDAGAAYSTITVDNHVLTNGGDYKITYSHTLTIVVTTAELGKLTCVRTFLVPVTGPVASSPSGIHLTAGTSSGVVGPITDVVDPYPNAVDHTGAVAGWDSTSHYSIKFTVTDVLPAASTITINGVAYTSGTDYHVAGAGSLTIVVTTAESGKATVVRTFIVAVTQVKAAAPSGIHLTAGSSNGVSGPITDVVDPYPNAVDHTGAVAGWDSTSHYSIKFTVTDTPPAVSTITINSVAYASGTDYHVAAAGSLTIVVTTAESGKATVVRTFIVAVTQVKAAAPSTIVLAVGGTDPVYAVTSLGYIGGEGLNTSGAVTWGSVNRNHIKFTVTDTPPAVSTITINGGAYTSGAEYVITSSASLTIVVTTTESGKATVVRTFVVAVTQAKATAPSTIVLTPGLTNPAYAVIGVGYIGGEGLNTTGKVTAWTAPLHDNIKFTVTDAGGVSTITINGVAYTSGNDYQVVGAGSLSIVVTTAELGKLSVVRTFTVAVYAPVAAAPVSFTLGAGSSAGVLGGFTQVTDPGPAGGSDSSGAVHGWAVNTQWAIKFTVVDSPGATSTITVDGAPYVSGQDLIVGAAGPITIVVTTSQSGRATVTRTFTVSVGP